MLILHINFNSYEQEILLNASWPFTGAHLNVQGVKCVEENVCQSSPLLSLPSAKNFRYKFFHFIVNQCITFFLNRDGSTSSALPSTSFSAWVYSNLVNLHRRSFNGHQNCGYRARLTSADESSTQQVEINLLKNVI